MRRLRGQVFDGAATELGGIKFAVTGTLFKVWNGSQWVVSELKRWNGKEWVAANVQRRYPGTWRFV